MCWDDDDEELIAIPLYKNNRVCESDLTDHMKKKKTSNYETFFFLKYYFITEVGTYDITVSVLEKKALDF